MTNKDKPSINNGNNLNQDQDKNERQDANQTNPQAHAGPQLVNDAPDILKGNENVNGNSRRSDVQRGQSNTQYNDQQSNQSQNTVGYGNQQNHNTQQNSQQYNNNQPKYEQANNNGENSQYTQTPPPNYQTPPPCYGYVPPYGSQGAAAMPGYGQRSKKNDGWKKGLMVFGIILAILVFFGYITNSFFSGMFTEEPAYEVPDNDYIARIAVEGEITSQTSDGYLASETGYNHQFTLDAIEDCINDSNNKAILLFVDTPGGGVYESDQIYVKLKEYKDTTGRPIYVAMGSMAASGGYYISAPADKILADRNTWTGSIGVTMGTFYDISGLLKKHKIKTETITSGRNKAMGSMVDPMTKEQRKIFQSLIDDAYGQFVGIIAEGRGMDLNKVKTLADGRIYTARQAEKNGLIDGIASEEETLEMLRTDYNLQNAEKVDFKYENHSWLDDFIYSDVMPVIDGLKNIGKGDLDTALKLSEENGNNPLMYMYEGN